MFCRLLCAISFFIVFSHLNQSWALEKGPNYMAYVIEKAKCAKNPTQKCEEEIERRRQELYTIEGVSLPSDADIRKREDQRAFVMSGTYLSTSGEIKSLSTIQVQHRVSEQAGQKLTIDKYDTPESIQHAPIIIRLEDEE